MPHSRNRPQHQHHQQQHHPTQHVAKGKKSSAAIIFTVFVGCIGFIIGYLTVGTQWQLFAIIALAALVGFFIGRKVDLSVQKKK